MKISFTTLTNNSNKYKQRTFTQKIKQDNGGVSNVQDSRWTYSAYVMANKIDYKNNPKEHEYDVMLGKKIEKLRSITQKLEQRIEQEADVQKKDALNKKLEHFNELKAVYVNQLTERHLPFALKMAHEYKYMGMPFNETLSAANIGLMRAAEKYSPSENPDVHFITYAKHWIFQQVQRDSSRDKQVRLPSGTLARYNKIKNAEFELKETLGRKPTLLEIAEYCELSERTVKMLLRHAGLKETSLNAQMTNDDDSKSLENVIPDQNAQKSVEDKMTNEDLSYMRYIIEKYLTTREKDVIKRRYRLDEEQKPGEFLRTLEEISAEIGLTRERIRQIETEAIAKIQKGKEIEEASKLKMLTVDECVATEQPKPKPQPIRETTIEKPTRPIEDKPKRTPLSSFLLLDYFSKALTQDLDEETTKKVIAKLYTYSAEEFEKIIENTTSKKRKEALLLKYSRANNPMGMIQNNNKIAKILGINYAGVYFREKEGLNDIRKFLIEGSNLNYVFLRENIISDIKNAGTKEKITKRLEKASDVELKSIMNNLLSKKEISVINERYGMNIHTTLGMKVKSIKETAENLGMEEAAVHFLTAKAIRRLKEYFSRPPTKNSNLSVFAKTATRKITDIEKRREAIRTLMKLDETTIDDFLQKILTPEEVSVIMIRYHLEDFDNARKTLVDKDTLAEKLGFKTRSKANDLEEKVFEKIKNYFENGYTSNRIIFAKKICETIEDETLKNAIEAKFTNLNEKDFDELLNNILTEKEKSILVKRYSLDNEESVKQKLLSRNNLMQEYQLKTNNAIRYIEVTAIEKIIQYFRAGLPSNVDVFAASLVNNLSDPEIKAKLTKKITSKNVDELKSDLTKILNPIDLKIIIAYFGLDEFIPIYKDLHPVDKLARELNKSKASIYTRKNQSMKKIFEYFNTDSHSNIEFLSQAITGKTESKRKKEKILSALENIDIKTLNEIIDKNLSRKEALVIKKRYKLEEYLPVITKLPTLKNISEEMNVSQATIYVQEQKGLNKLAEFFIYT